MPTSTEERFKILMDRTENMLEEWKTIKEKLTGIDFEITQIKHRQNDLDSRVKDLSRREEENTATVHSVRKNTHYQTAQQEQYSRNYNLRIYGLPEKKDENVQELEDMVLTFFQEKLGVQVHSNDIDVIHRLGRPKQTSAIPGTPISASTPKRPGNDRPDTESQAGSQDTESQEDQHQMETDTDSTTQSRTIIIRFVRRKTKNLIIANRRKLKKKIGQKQAVVIKEDLTKVHHQLLAKAKDVGEKAWSSEGKIFIKQKGKIREIHQMSDLM